MDDEWLVVIDLCSLVNWDQTKFEMLGVETLGRA